MTPNNFSPAEIEVLRRMGLNPATVPFDTGGTPPLVNDAWRGTATLSTDERLAMQKLQSMAGT